VLTLPAQLKQLVALQLVSALGADEFAFRHALMREAVYATLLRRERRAVHLAVASALEELHASALAEHLADLAYHYHQAGAWAKALDFARQAGEQAQRRYAPHEAHEHYTRALEAAHMLSGTRSAPPGLYRARGQVRELLGDFDGARADHEAALEAARAAADLMAEWQTLLDLGLLWAGRDYAQTGAFYRQAVDLARRLSDPVMLGHSLNWLANWHLNRDETASALAHHREALALFEAGGDRPGLALTLDLIGLTLANQGDLRQSRAVYTRALALFRELDDRRSQASCLGIMAEHGQTFVTETVVPVISLSQARADASQSLHLAHAIGWRAGEAYAYLVLSGLWVSAGDFSAAWRAAEHGRAIAAEIEHHQWLTLAQIAVGGYYGELAAFDEARQAMAAACVLADGVNSVLWQRFSRAGLAAICVAQDDLEAAQAALALPPAVPPAAHIPVTQAERMVALVWAELALARGDAASALEIVERLQASTPHAAAGEVVPRLWLLRGQILSARGCHAEAVAVLRAAQPAAKEIRTLTWRLHAALARVYAAQGLAAEAASESAAARAVIQAMAATLGEPARRETFVRAALARLPAGAPSA
jgi:tetratricopeptide (TPR) repeat protein